ncbi:MAG: choice-of-anchor D domain-containing protein, partial [Ignavibacteriaceae bacterium]
MDPNSGASNLIGETGVSLNGLSFNPTSGILWGSDYYNSIYMIDKSTAMSTLVGHINLDHETTDLHFDIAGNLYATVGGDNEETSYFVSIDKTTGEGSIIGEIGFQSVSGLAFYNVPIEGKHISVVPSSINFGLIEVDDNRSTTITISNIGTENLTITDITDPGVPFGLDSLPILPVVITSGNSEYFYITFSPTESGDFNNSFTISSDDENNPALEISLSGTAIILNPADSGACYASTSKADSSSLIRIDPATGAGSLIGNTGLDYMQSLAINSQGKILGSDNSGKIFGIDAVTGGAVFISNPQLGRLRAMAFDDNDSLYVMSDQDLYIVDLASGTSSYISNTNLSATGLSFNPTDGTLWASESDAIYTIDATTGMTTLIGNTNLEYETTGLHLDIAGNLYATVEEYDETNNYLAFIDKASGEAEIIGEIGLLSVSGLAFYNVPIAGKHIRVIQSIVYLGQAEIGDSSAKSINLSNIGTDDLTVSSISSPGDPFGLSDIPSLPLVISSGHSESFKVTFTAPDSGMFNSTVTIFSDDDDDPTLDLYISAEGIFIAPAEPGGCYALAVNNNNRINGRLFSIDPATGEGILIGPTGLEAYQMDIAINTGGKIYGLDHEGILYRIDAMTG